MAKNYRGIVKRCSRIKERQETYRKKRIECKKKKGDQQFTKDGHNAKITYDLVLEAKGKLSDNKVNGPEDAIASESRL